MTQGSAARYFVKIQSLTRRAERMWFRRIAAPRQEMGDKGFSPLGGSIVGNKSDNT